MPVQFEPIGKVVTENGRYFIELDKSVFPAVTGLDAFSHLLVLWWFHLYDSPQARQYYITEKPYVHGPDKIGVLATRSPVRPNPIAVTACALLGVDPENHRLEVGWIDAENDTPVLDIKPYEPSDDRVRDVVMPDWCRHWPSCLEESAEFDWAGEFNF
jgi:tRNA-Thr(GGU) m(6)t(6)A37 methyltransferase TsaA